MTFFFKLESIIEISLNKVLRGQICRKLKINPKITSQPLCDRARTGDCPLIFIFLSLAHKVLKKISSEQNCCDVLLYFDGLNLIYFTQNYNIAPSCFHKRLTTALTGIHPQLKIVP